MSRSLRVGYDRPAWMTAAVGEWAQISGTTAPGALSQYCGLGWRDDSTGVEMFSGAAGGHSSGQYVTNNEVWTLQLGDAVPAWVQRRAASTVGAWDTTGNTTPYMEDGRPATRHVYADAWWLPEQSAYYVGGMYWGSAGVNYSVSDGFVPSGSSGGDWQAAATYPTRPDSAGYLIMLSARDPSTGYLYGTPRNDGAKLYKFNPATLTWSNIATTGSANVNMGGSAFDTTRGNIYHLSGGVWLGPAAGVSSATINISTGARTAIGFNSSSAWTEFQADADKFVLSSLQYDATADCFYFYNGNSYALTGRAARVYKITPNGTTTWDMSSLSVTGVTPTNESNDSGVLSKFRYVSRWRVLIYVCSGQNIYYLRVA